MSAPVGTPVYSMISGTVVKAGKDNSSPNYLSVDVQNTEDGFWTESGNSTNLIVRHYHIDPIVNVGDTVTKGQQIGTVGDSAVTADNKHVHIDFCDAGLSGGYYSNLMRGRYTSLSAMPSNMQEKINMWANSYTAGASDWGRTWEIFASEGMARAASSSGKETLIVPDNFPFMITYYKGSHYPFYQGTSEQTLLSYKSDEATSAGVLGSAAAKYIYDHYGYHYGSEGRTKVRIEAADGGDLVAAGYYYIDDSNETGITADNQHWIFDIYVADYTTYYKKDID
ncbi:MAG: M23 family metallopeptidase [Prevotella sp.]|nr:M23 family metallopeptidase [Prevotella sp.]